MARKFKLHHRKHTGRLIHHRHTHYPVLVVMILFVGVLSLMTRHIATAADDLLVAAIVPAPIPAEAPVFTAPAQGAVLTKPAVKFTGTCPVITPAVIIALYEGSALLGSGSCQTDGSFQITASLTPGLHSVIATVLTITGDTGQSSQPLSITYRPSSAEPPAIPEAGSTAPLDIISDTRFLTFHNNLKAEWRGRFAGGIPPYTVKIAWGDGTVDTRTVTSNQHEAFSHTYRNNRLYTVTITLSDSSGLSLTRYYVALHSSGISTGTTRHQNNLMLFDFAPQDQYLTLLAVYICMLMLMLMLWRFEHRHYPQVIGHPMHYPWQKLHHKNHR